MLDKEQIESIKIKYKPQYYYLSFFVINLIIFSCFRFLFYLIYNEKFSKIPLYEVLKGFFYGIRFDAAYIATVGIVIFLFFILSSFRYRQLKKSIYVALILSLIIFIITIFIQLADLQYFYFSQKRLSYEIFQFLDINFFIIMGTAILENPVYILIFLLITGFLIYLSKRFLRNNNIDNLPQLPILKNTVILILGVILHIIAIRGGFQRVPLYIVNAFVSEYNMVNLMVLNSPYMILRTITEKSNKTKILIDEKTAIKNIYSKLQIKENEIINNEYPLFRKIKNDNNIKKYNVVIIAMESWTGKYVELNGDKLGVAPYFNKISKEGIFFKNFYSLGYKTPNALFSILTGYPDQVEYSVMSGERMQNRFASLSVLLKKYGYKNMFIHGGRVDFVGLRNMLIHEQFDLIVDKHDLQKCKKDNMERLWGCDDEYTFNRAIEEMKKTDSPFFAYIFSMSSHEPFILPENLNGRFKTKFKEDDHEMYEYLNLYHYSDWALGQFFEKIRKENFFENTIFVITADHTFHRKLSLFEDFHVPLLIYAPALLKPQQKNTIGSHIDILATVAGLLNLPYRADMGKDLLNIKVDDSFAYIIGGSNVYWVEDDYFSIIWLSKDHKPISYQRLNEEKVTISAEVSVDIREKALSFYQLSSFLLFKNKIIPENFEN
ncbi:MAG: sulfatase-like hydrolase/transferase [Spirochaetia bacterium]|nr:sulfatase-like hydrolase/transferase [Spirochaetia bacterium]